MRYRRPTSESFISFQVGGNGIFVSNHGGHQIEALPAVVAQVGKRAAEMTDSGVRSGPTWSAPMRSAPLRRLPARRFDGVLARSAFHRPVMLRQWLSEFRPLAGHKTVCKVPD
jgi:hypothetical protein